MAHERVWTRRNQLVLIANAQFIGEEATQYSIAGYSEERTSDYHAASNKEHWGESADTCDGIAWLLAVNEQFDDVFGQSGRANVGSGKWHGNFCKHPSPY